uniref:MATE family efflux transporter n=3 Tax=Aegilops tauschii TaxID=37682 RepID=A0A452XJ76_AEGTS
VMLLQVTMQFISTVMVGHLGDVALAGAAIANSLTNVSGFSVLVSKHAAHINLFRLCLAIGTFNSVRAAPESQ